jgi:hypothetical protein
LQIGLDESDCIVSAEYTAKRVITDPNNNLQPVLTFRKKQQRLMLVQSHCPTLRKLSELTVNAMLQQPKKLWQVSNCLEFTGHRSSVAFRQAVLTAQKLTGTHCFDLVEDAVTAVIKGYIPAPRRNDNNDTSIIHWEDDDDGIEEVLLPGVSHRSNSSSTTSWTTTTTAPNYWWPWSKGEDHHTTVVEEEDDDDCSSYYRSIVQRGGDGNKDNKHWTALDWMDWNAEQYERQMDNVQQQEQESLSRFANDWLSYVDLQYQQGQQSA